MALFWITLVLCALVLTQAMPLWLTASLGVLAIAAVLWRRRRRGPKARGLSSIEAGGIAVLVGIAFLLVMVVVTVHFALRWWEYLGSAEPADGTGFYWCSTDPNAPVFAVNEGTTDEPVWMVQHLSGQGDGYHALEFSDCRFSHRLQSPFKD